MRASPACQVSLRRFGAWRAAIAALVAAGAAVATAWLLLRDASVSNSMLVLIAVGALAVSACAVSLWHVPAQSLRWDGRAWQLDAAAGELSVAIDLGPWMLLRFKPESRARASWLPVQRAGLETQWHALRCAVYSPRPAAES